MLSELHTQPRQALERSPVMDDVGEENIAPSQAAAVALAREHMQASDAVRA
jgi:hypothetical protein